jgi:hypothetical protein
MDTTVADLTHTSKPVTRYAVYYCDNGAVIYGTATLLVGYGWVFKADDGSWFECVEPIDVARGKMELFGIKEMSDAQYALDMARRDAERREMQAQSAA